MNERVFWYGLDGKPIDDRAADQLLRDIGKRRVARTMVSRRPEVMVSTVFLVLNQNWHSDPQVLWETMVFGGDHQMRTQYATRAQARAGHRIAVSLVRAMLRKRATDRRRVSRMHASYRARCA